MKNLTKSIVTLTVLSSLAFAVPTAKQKFVKADINNDGVLSSQEFYDDQAVKMEQKIKDGKALKGVSTAPHFVDVDKNKDGKVTFKEYDEFHTIRQKDMVKIKNSNSGNSRGLEVFNKYDKNRDSVIDKREFRKLYQDMNNGQGGKYAK